MLVACKLNAREVNMADGTDLTELGINQTTVVAVEKLAEGFSNLTKDLPEAARIALASVLVGGALVLGTLVVTKKL
jgi:hypothetical protein